jgi:hypothetical protein
MGVSAWPVRAPTWCTAKVRGGELIPGILPFALRAGLWPFTFAPGVCVELYCSNLAVVTLTKKPPVGWL